MQKTVQATYEGGALHPLEPLPLLEHQRVTVTVFDHDAEIPPDHPLLVSADEWADAASETISLDEVRRALSGIEGSLSDFVIEERRER